MSFKSWMRGAMAVGLLGAAASPVMAWGEFSWPNTGRITSTWLYPNGTVHSGSADIAAPSWSWISASHQGNAYRYWQSGGCGNYSLLIHRNGYRTNYCHQVRWPLYGGGRWVNRNQLIGYVGTTGHSTGPHCHYTIFRWGARLRIPGIWIGKWVVRTGIVPGSYWGA